MWWQAAKIVAYQPVVRGWTRRLPMKDNSLLVLPRSLALKAGIGISCLVVFRWLWLWFGAPGILVGGVGALVLGGLVHLVKSVLVFRRTVVSCSSSRNDCPEKRESKKKSQLILQFVWCSVFYLAIICPILALLTDCHLLLVFLAVMTGVVFTGAVILVWATMWAIRKDTRENQFSISALLILTLLTAAYLGAIRWIADLAGEQLGTGNQTFLAAAVICVILTIVSLPFLVLTMESLVWFAAWLVRRRSVQEWIRRRSNRGETSREPR